jgi:hypothetical protein
MLLIVGGNVPMVNVGLVALPFIVVTTNCPVPLAPIGIVQVIVKLSQ